MPDDVKELVLSDARTTPLPELVRQARDHVHTLSGDAEALVDLESRARVLQCMLTAERSQEALARKMSAVYLEAARGIASELPPRGKGGRGKRTRDPFGFAAWERRVYRELLEPTDAEFDGWLAEAESLTKRALRLYGRKLAKARDRETGELLADPSDDDGDEEPEEPEEPVQRGMAEGVARLRELVAFLSPRATSSGVAAELLRLIRRALAIAGSVPTPAD